MIRGKGYGLARVYNCDFKNQYIKNHFWWEEKIEDAKIVRQFALYNYNSKNYKDAIKYFEKLLLINNEDFEMQIATDLYGIAICYSKLGAYEKALENFWKAVSLKNNYWEAYFEMMRVSLDKYEFEKADDFLEMCNVINKKEKRTKEKKDREFIYNDWKAFILNKRNCHQEALLFLKAALELKPDNERILNLINNTAVHKE